MSNVVNNGGPKPIATPKTTTATPAAASSPTAPAPMPAPTQGAGWAPNAVAAPTTGGTDGFANAPAAKSPVPQGVTGPVADKVGNGWPDVVGGALNIFGGGYGYAERIPGLGQLLQRYPVAEYSSKVSDNLTRGSRLDDKGAGEDQGRRASRPTSTSAPRTTTTRSPPRSSA